MVNYSDHYIKNELLEKYDQLPEEIKLGEICYAISSEWWSIFKFILDETRLNPDVLVGNPGPINNVGLLQFEDDRKQYILDHILDQKVSTSEMDKVCDWNFMRLKDDLSFIDDFIIVSQKVWNFLRGLFGGGPAIELFAEPIKSNVQDKNCITHDKWPLINPNSCVSLDLKRIYIIQEQDAIQSFCFYASLSASAKSFFTMICEKLGLQTSNSQFSFWDSNQQHIEITIQTIKSLEELGMSEDCMVCLTYRSETNAENEYPGNFINVYSDRESEEQKHDWLNDSTSHEPYFGNERGHNNTSTKTVSTGLPNQNSLDLNDCMIGEEELNFNDQQDLFRIEPIDMKGNEAKLSELHDKVKMTVKEEKIHLNVKPLKEIRHNLSKLQGEWRQLMKPKMTKKF